MQRQFDMVRGYLALARRPGNAGLEDERIRLLVRQPAAERSRCRWCMGRAQHDWRMAGLPVDLLRRLDRHASEPGLTDGERAMAELIACMAEYHLITDESR